MEQRNLLHTLFRKILGQKYILHLTDTAQIMSRQELFTSDPEMQATYKRISQQMRNCFIGGGALGLALSLSMRRYFPRVFSTLNSNQVLFDMLIMGGVMIITTKISMTANQNDLLKIKKELLLSYDKKFLNHMATLEILYEIEEEDQIREVFSREDYDQWLSQRHTALL